MAGGDIQILGGGLAGGLIARALVARRPDLSVTLIERGETLGGNHVWSFFDGDIAGASLARLCRRLPQAPADDRAGL